MDKARFANSLSRIESLIPKVPTEVKSTKEALLNEGLPSFGETLSEVAAGATLDGTPGLKPGDLKSSIRFSNHAVERMQTRGISFNPESMQRLDEAIKKAAAKGSKDTLVLMDESALIVSVKNNTVVTVMDKNALKENVFTNIDSTVVL
jgi:flagellar operon protein